LSANTTSSQCQNKKGHDHGSHPPRFIFALAMRPNTIQFLLLLNFACSGQVIEGNWIIADGWRKGHLIEFKNSLAKSEFARDWKEYKVHGTRLSIFTESEYYDSANVYYKDTATLEYNIDRLTKDSLFLTPVKKDTTENQLQIFISTFGTSKMPMTLINRNSIYKNIEFDSVTFSSETGPVYYQTYYSPKVTTNVVVTSRGVLRYAMETIDTLSNLEDRKKIKWLNELKDSEYQTVKVKRKEINQLHELLNTSNIQNINIEEDFIFYKHRFHSEPSTLSIYKDGKKTYEIMATDYPWTLVPVINYLLKLKDKMHK
jgi:hypothetical protein